MTNSACDCATAPPDSNPCIPCGTLPGGATPSTWAWNSINFSGAYSVFNGNWTLVQTGDVTGCIWQVQGLAGQTIILTIYPASGVGAAYAVLYLIGPGGFPPLEYDVSNLIEAGCCGSVNFLGTPSGYNPMFGFAPEAVTLTPNCSGGGGGASGGGGSSPCKFCSGPTRNGATGSGQMMPLRYRCANTWPASG